jgi:predicted RNA-binding protein with TRAM domain
MPPMHGEWTNPIKFRGTTYKEKIKKIAAEDKEGIENFNGFVF